jgi:hypothetical protein
MVGARGFEPPTPRSRTECSTRLSHAPTRRYCIPALVAVATTLVVAKSPSGRTKGGEDGDFTVKHPDLTGPLLAFS